MVDITTVAAPLLHFLFQDGEIMTHHTLPLIGQYTLPSMFGFRYVERDWLGLGEANQRHSRAAHSFAIQGKKILPIVPSSASESCEHGCRLLLLFHRYRKTTKQTDTFQLVLPSQVLFFIITSQPTVSKPHDPQNQHTEALSCLPLSTKTVSQSNAFHILGGKKI